MIKAIIVDDEQPSLDKLEKHLMNSGLVEVTGKFTNPLEAEKYLKKNDIDAAFLDIEMPDMNGIELANEILDMQGNTAIVFVTAYNQYAVEAFRLNALDYLLKPVSMDRLMETLDRITKRLSSPIQPKRLSIRCFGKFCVTAGSEEIRFRTEKAEELLAYLVDQQGAFVSRNKIVDSLWGDFDADRAIVHFNTTLYYVKKALLPFEIRVSIEFDRGSYRLDVTGLECDYLKFCAFTQRRKLHGKESIRQCEKIAELYTGEYLSGRDYAWVTSKRLTLEEQFFELLLVIAQYYKEEGRYPEAIHWLKKGLAYEPIHREINYRLMEALLAAKERLMAVKYYDVYRDGLLKRLGQEPDEAFRKLFG